MKTLSQKTLLLVINFFFVTLCYGQLPAISLLSSTPYPNAVCPGDITAFSVNFTSMISGFTPTWYVSGNGNFIAGTDIHSTSVDVTWYELNDPSAVEGTVSVVFRKTGQDNIEVSKSIVILDISGKDFGSYTSSVNVPYCLTSPVNLLVGNMYIPGLSSTQVDFYQWHIPSGWMEYNTSHVGPVTVNKVTPFISLIPTTNCSVQVNVDVYASINNTCPGSILSHKATISLIPPSGLSVVPPSGYTGAMYGDMTPVTFTTQSISCATYNWTIPAGWSGSSNTNSITLTPNGCPFAGAHNVSVSANLGNCTISSSAYTVNFNYPINFFAAGPSNICAEGGYFLFESFPSTLGCTWSVSPSSMFVTSSGSGASTTLIPVNGSVTGVATITFTPSCGPTSQYSFWVGPPQGIGNPYNSIPGYFSTSDLYTFEIVPQFFTGHWTVDGGYFSGGWDGGESLINFTRLNDFATITVDVSNDCGVGPLSLSVFVGQGNGDGGGGCPPGDICPNVIYPNPSDEELQVSLTQPPAEKRPIEVMIYDSSSNLAYQGTFIGKDFKIHVKSFPDGIYYVHFKRGGKTVQKRIVIRHK